jgi:N-methylhydantoinase A
MFGTAFVLAPSECGDRAWWMTFGKVIGGVDAIWSTARMTNREASHRHTANHQSVIPAPVEHINRNFNSLVENVFSDLHAAGFSNDEIEIIRSMDVRYRYQVHELNIPLPVGTKELTAQELDGLYGDFDTAYEQSYGQGAGYLEAGKEIITFRVTGTGKLPKRHIQQLPRGENTKEGAHKGSREVYFELAGGFVETPIYDFTKLGPGVEVEGPAVIESHVTTIVLNPNDGAVMDEFHNIRILIRS